MKWNAQNGLVASALAGLLPLCIPSASLAQAGSASEQEHRPSAGLYQQISASVAGIDGGQGFVGGQAAAAMAPGAAQAPLILQSSEAQLKPGLIRSGGEGGHDGGPAFFIPPGARPFLPDDMTTPTAGSLWAQDSAMTREQAQRLADYFQRFYPDVVYHVNWDDETVNAYAWKEGNTRHVALMGGLMRHKAIQGEGLALVLAHELGHHYGGEPTYSSGLSCEGQADYWGAAVGMRSAWGDRYRDQMLAAIDQLDEFFTRGVQHRHTEQQEIELMAATDNCGHPPAACRKKTYQAAMAGQPKPECAGPTVPARRGFTETLSMLPMGAPPS